MDTKPRSSLGQVIGLFLRLGFTAFGGPAAHIAMMHDEVVVRRGWLDEQHFLDLVGATNLIPGPNSTEMAIHIGYDRAGWRGLVAAGVCFILPATLIVGSLAWAYVAYGRTPQGEALLYGINVAGPGLDGRGDLAARPGGHCGWGDLVFGGRGDDPAVPFQAQLGLAGAGGGYRRINWILYWVVHFSVSSGGCWSPWA